MGTPSFKWHNIVNIRFIYMKISDNTAISQGNVDYDTIVSI